ILITELDLEVVATNTETMLQVLETIEAPKSKENEVFHNNESNSEKEVESVQVSNWEPSFQLHELLGGAGKDSFGTADLFERVQLIQKPTAVNVKHLAYQLFNKMLLSSRREQYNNQQLKISKSWHFKFKTKATRESSHANLWYNETIEAVSVSHSCRQEPYEMHSLSLSGVNKHSYWKHAIKGSNGSGAAAMLSLFNQRQG
ncbi:unnamed protein product, partial [Brassica oleracea]